MIISSFDTECGLCVGDIDAGVTEIIHDPEYGWIHADEDECNEDHPDNDDEPFASR